MNYFYSVSITGGRNVHLKEMNLEQYKNLQKICVETNFDNFKTYILKMIRNLLVEEDTILNLLDIYIIVLTIRKYSISDEKVFNTYKEGKKTSLRVDMDQLIEPILDKYAEMCYETYELGVSDFIADTIVLNPYDCQNYIESFISNGKKIVIPDNLNMGDLLPLPLKNKIDNYLADILDEYNIELFTLIGEDNTKNTIRFEMSEQFVYDFLRIILKDDLKILYRNLYDVKHNLNIGFEEHKYISLSELEIYISMFNSDQEKKQNPTNWVSQINM